MSVELELSDEELEELDQDEHRMSTVEHSTIASTIIREMGNFVKNKDIGRVLDGSVEYRFLQKAAGNKRNSSRQPDVSFLSKAKLPQRFRNYADTTPDLAIEIESPTDKAYKVDAKIEEYQQAGVKLVWLIRPVSRRVDIYRLTSALLPEPVGIKGELSGEDILPGFKLAVSEIFDFPADPDPDTDK